MHRCDGLSGKYLKHSTIWANDKPLLLYPNWINWFVQDQLNRIFHKYMESAENFQHTKMQINYVKCPILLNLKRPWYNPIYFPVCHETHHRSVTIHKTRLSWGIVPVSHFSLVSKSSLKKCVAFQQYPSLALILANQTKHFIM